MKRNIIYYTLAFLFCIIFTSCEKYLSIIPKGEKIPTTYADFEALLRDEYGVHHTPVRQATILLNDRFVSSANLNYYRLYDANYFWREEANRIELNNADEDTYYKAYASISTCNLIIENGNGLTEASEQQIKELIATAKVLRSFEYFILANYYAATYQVADAKSLKSIPLILSANVGAPHNQVSIQELYEFMISEINAALPDLQPKGLTILHPAQGAANALLARIYLQMGSYDLALTHANKALAINDQLFDWRGYYEQNKATIQNPTDYTLKRTPMTYSYVENYYFQHGLDASNYETGEYALRIDRASYFEAGDTKFLSRWKKRTVGPDTYFTSSMTGYHNIQGLTTVEVYLIKAECLARTGQVASAIEILNKVRQTRILASEYLPLSTLDATQAIKWIHRTKGNELIFSIVPFADKRRLNKEEPYKVTMSKTENDKSFALTPESHMWIMPIPLGAILNPGNGTITQNVDK